MSLLGGGLFAVTGSGLAAAKHVPETPRITFNKQTRRVRANRPTTVVVPRADLPEGGYVVIHHGRHEGHANGGGDHTHGGGDHHIIGHSEYLEPGHYGGLKIPVSPPGTGEQTLTAMLHKEDGDNREFNHPGGDPHYTSTDESGPVRDIAEVTFK
jgi:hypothetical protein